MKFIEIVILFSSVITISYLSSCSPQKSIYKVAQISEDVLIDGKDTEDLWSQGELLKDFVYPWKEYTPPLTTFKAVHNDEYLYFFYHAQDDDIRLQRTGDEEMDAVSSDRVEIFIRSEDEDGPYYSFEMDPLGRVFDSKGEFGKYIDKDYDYPSEGLEFVGLINDDNYTLEGRLRLSTLRELDLITSDDKLYIGLYRGEYMIDDNGQEKTNWISWIIPDSETPNFHIPSSFGQMILL